MEIKHDIDFKKIPFFQGLTSEEVAFILPFMEEKKFAQGKVILPQGSHGGNLYLVISGLVAIDIILPGDHQKRLATLGHNALFGEVTFLSNALVTASVIAIEPCSCIIFHHELLEMLRTSKPEISFKIEKKIAYQLANKIVSNINTILKIINTIPQDLQIPSEHSLYLESSSAGQKELDISKLDFKHLRKLNFFCHMSKKQILKLLPLMKAQSYDKGYRFLSKDRNLNKLGIVYSGAAMLFIKENNQLKKSIAISGIGEMLLQNFIFSEFRQVADYVTCEKCILLELDMDVYKKLKHSNPDIFYIISEMINREIAGSVYITNRQLVRINSEYNNILS
ncbi:cNMP binding domain-containing protein [Legionella gratiana]|uniref:cNMP binding domain-containing protein n=1 Tax=Legionella gratiana TaxID=45066 RepID=A0A378JEI5_9GAMM|nr:cyclic nucleotide-binding domain-containing protein [Legionella gratiana]KTD05500.1 cNMP binding domain-containing protein [Legionella gratiana]STX45401.1 cNMP binding domain-containing protein [Legionella gratiana]